MTVTVAGPNELRAALAEQLSKMYASEVPKYGHLVDATNRVNAAHGDDRDAQRLGSERHGAVRVASFGELEQLAALFGLFGMQAVGYYDLRTSATPIPVVSTAFRPIDAHDMAASPFRMFTSTLVADDERFFSSDMQAELADRIARRTLIGPELAELIANASAAGAIDQGSADRFVELTVDVFRLNAEPIDASWHEKLDAISPVASDIAAAAGTHLNHLTPRVVDIGALHQLMEDEGVTMIDRIQGPPSWDGPDVLLQQTSFRALDETRHFVNADGDHLERTVRVRFGEVEQRGIALTPAGRSKVDAAMDAVKQMGPLSEPERVAALRNELNVRLDASFAVLVANGDAYAEYRPVGTAAEGLRSVDELIAAGNIALVPITYEDFLPASAAGIFASNLAHDGAAVDDVSARLGDAERLREAVGTLHDPYALYAAQQSASLVHTRNALGVTPR